MTRLSFHRIAYEALEVCNAVELATIETAVARTGLQPGARALDIGCGNGSVSIRLAERFRLAVDAVELDPIMAALAAERIAAAGAAVALHVTRSGEVLTRSPPYDLIVALGATEPVGGGVRAPLAMFEGLRRHLTPGGWLLWGDLTWIAEPSPPVRQLAELANTYADDTGWRDAAAAAGFEVVSGAISPPELWDRYGETTQQAVAAWLAAHADHPDAPSVGAAAHRLKLLFDFGRGALGFGLYLLRA